MSATQACQVIQNVYNQELYIIFQLETFECSSVLQKGAHLVKFEGLCTPKVPPAQKNIVLPIEQD